MNHSQQFYDLIYVNQKSLLSLSLSLSLFDSECVIDRIDRKSKWDLCGTRRIVYDSVTITTTHIVDILIFIISLQHNFFVVRWYCHLVTWDLSITSYSFVHQMKQRLLKCFSSSPLNRTKRESGYYIRFFGTVSYTTIYNSTHTLKISTPPPPT